MTSDERFERIENGLAAVVEAHRMHAETLGQLMQTISAYVDAADARMRRTETNLDVLIRAITAEHSNGHGSR